MGHLRKLTGRHFTYLLRYPGITPRVLRNYFTLLCLRRPVLRGVEFSITYDCPLQCRHCSKSTLEQEDRPPLTPEEIRSALRQAIKLGALNINFTGGEATLRQDLPQLIRAAEPRRTVVSLATSGVPFTAEQARNLKDAGLRIVSISLDAPTPEGHDDFRCYPGCFDQVVTAVRNAKAAGLEVFLCMVLARVNTNNGDVERVRAIAREHGATLTLQMACAVGSWTGRREVLLDEAGRRRFRELTREEGLRWEGASNYLAEGCPAGTEKIYITTYGDVLPCNFTHISFGNLREEPLERIWRRMHLKSPFARIYDRCLVAEDETFQRRFLEPLEGAPRLPLRYSDHPLWADGGDGPREPGEARPVARGKTWA